MKRSTFLRTAAGLLLFADPIELLDPRRKYWPGAEFSRWKPVRLPSRDEFHAEFIEEMHRIYGPLVRETVRRSGGPLLGVAAALQPFQFLLAGDALMFKVDVR